jgi:hypothetical protein
MGEAGFRGKKYAFAADYIRLYALYHFGGIYLDSDVVVYKSFNDLLELPYFIGEDYVHWFEPAIIGAEKGTPWLLDVLKRYEGLSFIGDDGLFNMRGLPYVFHDQLTPKYKFKLLEDKNNFVREEEIINIFPYDYFNSRDFIAAKRYKNSYCSHNYVGSWMKKKDSLKDKIKLLIPRSISNLIYRLYYYKTGYDSIQMAQIPYTA